MPPVGLSCKGMCRRRNLTCGVEPIERNTPRYLYGPIIDDNRDRTHADALEIAGTKLLAEVSEKLPVNQSQSLVRIVKPAHTSYSPQMYIFRVSSPLISIRPQPSSYRSDPETDQRPGGRARRELWPSLWLDALAITRASYPLWYPNDFSDTGCRHTDTTRSPRSARVRRTAQISSAHAGDLKAHRTPDFLGPSLETRH